MYRPFFALRQAPFSGAPDPDYLFLSRSHRKALGHLYDGLESEDAVLLLTGEAGSGKTTLCQCLLQQAPSDVLLTHIPKPPKDLPGVMRSICDGFHMPLPAPPHSAQSLSNLLRDFLRNTCANGQRAVVLIDDAHHLTPAMLEWLGDLTRSSGQGRPWLGCMLVGRPDLHSVLEQAAAQALARQVNGRCHLAPLDELETRHYIEHRMRVAGLKGPVPFSETAQQHIHRLSGGVPQRINLMCDQALQNAHQRSLQHIDEELVTQTTATAPGAGSDSSRTSGGLLRHRWTGLALASLVLSAAAGWWWSRSPPDDTTRSATVAQANAQVAPNVESDDSAATPPAEAVVPGMPALAQLPDDEPALWHTLAGVWGTELPARGDPCRKVLPGGLQCIRVTGLHPDALQQFDRPGLLLLHEGGRRRWVMVEALRDGRWQLRTGAHQWALPQADLTRWWRGDYASLWRLPPGQTRRLYAATPDSPAGRWLDEQLSQLQQRGQLDATAQGFAARVRALQQQYGLHGDGKALPSTFLLVNRLSGVDEPRLVR